MTAFDYSTADEQRSFELIPSGTNAVIEINLRPGNAGEGGLLTRTKSVDKDGKPRPPAEALDLEFIIIEGPFAKRKLWGFYVVSGTTDGHEQAADITKARLRAFLESARNIKPTDVSEAAKKARTAELTEFDGLRFMGKIGIERGTGDYIGKDKNILLEVITPDRKEWHPIQQVPKQREIPLSSGSAVTPITKPQWAK
jgi:hypothetical protein